MTEASCSRVCGIDTNQFFPQLKFGRNGNFVFKGFNSKKKQLPPVGLELVQEIIAGLGVKCLTI